MTQTYYRVAPFLTRTYGITGGHGLPSTPTTPPAHLDPALKARPIPAQGEALGTRPRQRRFRSAEGRSAGAAETTKLLSLEPARMRRLASIPKVAFVKLDTVLPRESPKLILGILFGMV